MTKDEALDKALEALEQYTNVVTSVNDPNSWETVVDGGKPARDAITAIKQARSAPVQEPVATVTSESGNPDVTMSWWHEPALPVGTKLYTTPPAPPVHEPVAWMRITDITELTDSEPEEDGYTPLYTTPPAAQRQCENDK
jgi:hypothetical protein